MTSVADPSTVWPSDLTSVCERLAVRFASDGAAHPVAASVVLAARGHSGLDTSEFAKYHELPVDALRRAEAGEMPWEDLPDIIGELLEVVPTIDLLALADLEAQLRRPSSEL
jgi:hypothetical protein